MKTKNYKGITLIALIITIIVLLILAGVSISLVVGDNGVLGQAVNATTATDIAETKEAIELAVIGYLDENGNYTIADVAKAVADSGATLGEDGVTVTTAKGNMIDITELVEGASDYSNKVWYINDDGYVTDGDVEVAIGDYVNYTPSTSETYSSYSTANGSSDQTFSSSDYTGTWRVIGVEDGKVLLVSTGTVGTLSLYGQLGYQNGVDELNNICAIYGTGKYANEARSFNFDDICNLIDSEPETFSIGSGTIYEYGNEVTYTMTGGVIAYKSTNSSGTSSVDSFTYYNETTKTWESLSDEGDQVKLTSTFLHFWISSTQTGSNYMSVDSTIEDVLMGCGGYYWLGSPYVGCYGGNVIFGLRCVWADGGTVDFDDLADSYGGAYSNSYGVRAAVSLKSGISLTSAGSNTWSISE